MKPAGAPAGAARRRWLLAGVAVAAAGAGVGAAFFQRQRQAARSEQAQREQAFWSQSFERPDGAPLRTAELRGRPLLVNFWATWCPPCIKEMPLLDRFAQRHRGTGWQVLGIAVDQAPQVLEFLQRQPVSFPIGLAGSSGAAVSRGLGNSGGQLPYSVVFDRHGRVVARHLGTVDDALLEDWVKSIG